MRSSPAVTGPKKDSRAAAAATLLEYFYPVHYQIGTALEDVVRAGVLSRQQAAILWLLRCEGEPGFRMRRKDIEANIRRWFEVTSAAVTRSLRAMMRPPLELIEISEDPKSGREKLVALTPTGRKFLAETTTEAAAYLAALAAEIPLDLQDRASEFFRELTAAFQRSTARRRMRLIRPKANNREGGEQ